MRKTAIPFAAIAALALAGCATNGGDAEETPTETATETETAAPEPTVSEEPDEPEGQWAEPVESDELVGEAFDSDEPAAVRWVEVGETLQIVVMGSSSAGCIPVPIDAWTDGEEVEVEFEPADEDTVCTMDLQTHVWTVTWDEPLEVDGPLPLYLTNVEGADSKFETELSPEPVQ